MKRTLELAQLGAGKVSPNPMVGCVIVHNDKIIGEGWHQKFGEAHAEVNAINSVADKSLLRNATVYVNLEPCSHFGKTPPCADLLIEHKVKEVVIGMPDPFEKVAGRGMQKLKDAGITVKTGILEDECKELNKRFITFHTKKRPYVILKWAQTADGFISPNRAEMSEEEFNEKRHITGRTVQRLVHKWRGEEDAIFVGTNTILTDNPHLNTREWKGKNPLRIVLDSNLRLPANSNVFDRKQPTLLFTFKKETSDNYPETIVLNEQQPIVEQILNELYKRNILSLIVEGGTTTLKYFIEANLWDEAQIFTTPSILKNGIEAAKIKGGRIISETMTDTGKLTITRNTK